MYRIFYWTAVSCLTCAVAFAQAPNTSSLKIPPPPGAGTSASVPQVTSPVTTQNSNSQGTSTIESVLDYRKLRDPFKSPDFAENKPKESKEEIELLNVEDLKLVGLITGSKIIKAIVATTDKDKTYIVSERMRIGSKHGVVKKILSDRVIVQERELNPLGEQEVFTTVIKLPTEEEANKK